MSRIVDIQVRVAKSQLTHRTWYKLRQKLHVDKAYVQPVKMTYNMENIKLCMRRTLTRHKALETIGWSECILLRNAGQHPPL